MRSFDEAMKRIPSQSEKIINLLKEALDEGVTNVELAEITFKYDARISELRMKGYIIDTIYVGKSVYKYVLKKIPSDHYNFRNATDEVLLNMYDEFGEEVSTFLAALLEDKGFHITRKSGWYKHNRNIH
jgi:hypothetical protein